MCVCVRVKVSPLSLCLILTHKNTQAALSSDPMELMHASTACFSVALVESFLKRAGASAEDAVFRFKNEARSTSIEWALGALVLGAGGGPASQR